MKYDRPDKVDNVHEIITTQMDNLSTGIYTASRWISFITGGITFVTAHLY